MKPSLSRISVLVLAGALSASAEKIPNDFRAEFERTFREKQSYAVVMQDRIPTTSVYGTDGKQTDAYFSIDVVDGRMQESKGVFDLNQTAADELGLGEVLELVDVSYKDNRIDLRCVSLEAHKVKRGEWLLKTEKREPVSTNFKFFLPFDKKYVLSPNDMVKVLRYVEDYLKVFPSEEAARAYSAKLVRGRGADEPRRAAGAAAAPPRPGPAAEQKSERKEIKVGMTPLQVIDILGKPQKEVSFENSSKWTYPDLTVIFENGKVKEVRF